MLRYGTIRYGRKRCYELLVCPRGIGNDNGTDIRFDIDQGYKYKKRRSLLDKRAEKNRL